MAQHNRMLAIGITLPLNGKSMPFNKMSSQQFILATNRVIEDFFEVQPVYDNGATVPNDPLEEPEEEQPMFTPGRFTKGKPNKAPEVVENELVVHEVYQEGESYGHVIKLFYPKIIVPHNPEDKRGEGLSDELDYSFFLSRLNGAFHGLTDLLEENDEYTGEIEVDIIGQLVPEGDLTNKLITDSATSKLSFNNFDVLVDPFMFYLGFFDKEAIKENLEYLASAYYKSYVHEDNALSRPSEAKWRKLIRSLIPSEELTDITLVDAYRKVDSFAYTVITMHTLVLKMHETKKRRVESYRRKLVAFYIRKALRGIPDSYAKAFAMYIQDEVFYIDKQVYHFTEGRCKADSSLSVVNMRYDTFYVYTRAVVDQFINIKRAQGKTIVSKDVLNVLARCANDFTLRTAEVFTDKVIKKFLKVDRRDGSNTYGTAYKDGVVMMRYIDGMPSLVIRETLMEDQIFDTGNAFIRSSYGFSWEHPLIKKIDKCFHQVFGEVFTEGDMAGEPDTSDDQQTQWFYRWLASLHAKNPERCFLILYGEKGGNAKSVIMNALGEMFGKSYYYPAPDNLLHQDVRSGHQASLAELEGKNLTVSSEPATGREINATTVKSITGGDKVTYSRKGKDPKEFLQICKYVWLCNRFPQITNPDDALLSRMFIIECIGRYKHLPPNVLLEPHLYRADDNFWKQPGIHDALLWIMLNKWSDYAEKRLVRNSKQEAFLEKWNNNNSTVSRFMENNCIVNPDACTLQPFKIDQVYDTYTAWLKEKRLEMGKLEKAEFEGKLKLVHPPTRQNICVRGGQGRNVVQQEVYMLHMKDPKNQVSGSIWSNYELLTEEMKHQLAERQAIMAGLPAGQPNGQPRGQPVDMPDDTKRD